MSDTTHDAAIAGDGAHAGHAEAHEADEGGHGHAGHDEHGHGEALGPTDWMVWGAGALGVALGAVVAICMYLSVGGI
jgi:ABC-type Zn2+ transport system substrate-binding protein/surface adhesin